MNRNLLLAACAALALSVSAAQAAPPAHIAAAVANADRPAADKERDAARKPAEMLEFAGVKQGDVVVELLPGGGYFTRVLSAAVGPNGKVFAAVTPADLEKAKAAAKGNVIPVPLAAGAFKTPEPVDVMFTAQNYHDFHLKRLNLDVAAVNKALFDTIKPGGTLLIIDHTAVAGAPVEVADTLHRIDPAIVKREVEAAGFQFVGENNALRNPADAKTIGVFDPAIRGKTDQFVYKFKKPG
ncbi:class I SAM-dependent methyltransferase [Phenylobacterium sp.]|uniref:class I SAM-dependent methyltransferase n=1 Tax=Phenylobacterium sp. TaxID=1871053 RepID=UPI00273465E1|nr:methyltransferase [Phenylobacterium sp.]MDP3854210.1 methyltransferase [Phenylobacterium sp.]